MNIIRLIIALATLGATLCANANTFVGTITQTVTETNDPLYQVGQTFVGTYIYKAPTADGVFYTDNQGTSGPLSPKPPGALATLNGVVYMPFATTATYDSGLYAGQTLTGGLGGSYNGLLLTRNEGTLTVAGGVVTDFFWSFEQGGFYTYLDENSFGALSFYDRGQPTPTTRGTVVFSKPVGVPDSGSTLGLISGALLCSMALKRIGMTLGQRGRVRQD